MSKVLSALLLAAVLPNVAQAADRPVPMTCRFLWQDTVNANSNPAPKVVFSKTINMTNYGTFYGGEIYGVLPNGVSLYGTAFGADGANSYSAGHVFIRSGNASLNALASSNNPQSIVSGYSSYTATYLTPQGPKYIAECWTGTAPTS